MKTPQEIFERIKSPESADFFNVQRSILLCLLPFEVAKPLLNPEYVKEIEDGTIAEDEKWVDDMDAEKQLLEFLPVLDKTIERGNYEELTKSFMAINAWIWVIDETFFDEVQPMYSEDLFECIDQIVKHIHTRFNYTPTVETIEFENIPDDSPSSTNS